MHQTWPSGASCHGEGYMALRRLRGDIRERVPRWRGSLPSVSNWGSRGRWFESSPPDQVNEQVRGLMLLTCFHKYMYHITVRTAQMRTKGGALGTYYSVWCERLPVKLASLWPQSAVSLIEDADAKMSPQFSSLSTLMPDLSPQFASLSTHRPWPSAHGASKAANHAGNLPAVNQL